MASSAASVERKLSNSKVCYLHFKLTIRTEIDFGSISTSILFSILTVEIVMFFVGATRLQWALEPEFYDFNFEGISGNKINLARFELVSSPEHVCCMSKLYCD